MTPINYCIKQIMPATGWVAVFVLEGQKDRVVALVAWAIVKTGDYEEVVGLIAAEGEVVEARHQDGFLSYNMTTDGKPLKIHY